MSVPEPNSPEALRAAQKVRNVFYMIAAANIVLIAIVMWPRPKLQEVKKVPAAPPESETAFGEMEATFGRVVAAYHARDAERFAAEFASTAVPKPDEEYFRTVIIEQYADKFGELTNPTRIAAQSETNPMGGILVTEFTAKKRGIVKSRAEFAREDGKMRVKVFQLLPQEKQP